MNSLHGGHHVNSRFDHSNVIKNKISLLKIGILVTVFIVFMSVSNLPASYAYTLLTSIPVGANPIAIAFDPVNGNVYVANYGSSTVSVINGTSNSVIGSIQVGSGPHGVTSGNGNVYVANYISSTVSVINETSNSVIVPSIQVGTYPDAIAFDSANGNVYVANYGSNNVSVINGTSNSVIGSIQVGSSPSAIAFDPVNGNVYVANYGSNNVSVINGNSVIGSPIVVGSGPDSVTSGNGNVYVSNYNDNSISVITSNSTTSTIGSVTTPSSIVFDSSNANIYAAEMNQNNVAVISTQSTSGPTPTTTSVASSPNHSTAGQTVTFTATVSSSSATGTVQFNIDGTAAGSPLTLTGGQAIFSTSALSIGTHTITATYSGDSNNLGSTSTALSFTVKVATATKTSVTSSPNPSVTNKPTWFTATVSPSNVTGAVQFDIDNAAAGSPLTLTGGQAVLGVSTLSAGKHNVTAAYSGNSNYSTSLSPVLTQTVNNAATATTTSVVSSANPSTVGQAVAFTATVSSSSATGTVQFNIDGTAAGSPLTLTGGQATFSTSALSIGTHTITATYSGDSNNLGSTSTALTQTVNIATATTTSVVSSANPSTVGQAVAFTATVSSSSATGTVQFNIDGTAAGSPLTLAGGQAVLGMSTLPAGTHNVTATYSGDANDAGSTSAVLTQTVNQVIGYTTTSVASSLNPSVADLSVNFTATVSPSTATGTVQFNIDGTATGSPLALTGGQAVLGMSALSAGTHTITATYSGDSNNLGSTSAALTQTVSQVITTTAVVSSHNPSTAGQAITFTAMVSSSIATGTVQFNIDGTAVGSPLTLAGGQAIFSTSTLSIGTHTITATYSGDTNDAGSTSTALTQTVNLISVTLVPSTTSAIQSLISTVNGMNINHGQTDKLDNSLNAAINYLNSGNYNMAKQSMSDFIGDANKLSGQQLQPSQATTLINQAQSIINTIGSINILGLHLL